MNKISFSIVVPFYNPGPLFSIVLDSLAQSITDRYEVILINDNSDDGSENLANKYGFQVFSNSKRSGAAQARNHGAKLASGDYIIFMDSDVVITKNILQRVEKRIIENREIDILQGFYGPYTRRKNYISLYKHLWINYTYKILPETIYWVFGCFFVIKRRVFIQSGGFDPQMDSYCATDDIEFGKRLNKLGYKIVLDKELQVEHLRYYNLLSLLSNDFKRGRAWSEMFLSGNNSILWLLKRGFLNISPSFLISIPLSWLIIVSSLVSPFFKLFIMTVLLFIIYCGIQAKFIIYLITKMNILFGIIGLFVGFVDHFVCGMAVIVAMTRKLYYKVTDDSPEEKD